MITSTRQVRRFLRGVSVGETVSVGSSLFSAQPLVTALFGMLPSGDDPVELVVTAVDVKEMRLSGTSTVLGLACTATFKFWQPRGGLLFCWLRIVPNEAVSWTLLSSWNVTFSMTAAVLMTYPEPGVVTLTFEATLGAGSMTLPVSVSVPSFDGDWTLVAGDASQVALDSASLQALMGNQDVMNDLLPSGAFDTSSLSINLLQVSFNPSTETCTILRLGLGYAADWTIGPWTVTGLTFELNFFQPFSSNSYLQGVAEAQITNSSAPSPITLDVGVQFDPGTSGPSYAIFIQLPPGNAIAVADLFAFFGVSLPTGFPTADSGGDSVDVTRLSFYIWPAAEQLSFSAGIEGSIPIVGGVSLQFFSFDVAGGFGSGGPSPSGSLATSFLIGSTTPTTLLLYGSYASSGLSLAGSATNVPIGSLLETANEQFGVTLPAPIQQLVLQTLSLSFATSATGGATTSSFNFTCQGTTTIAGVQVQFTPVIALTSSGSGFTGLFSGTLVITTPSQTLTFDVTFDDSPASTVLTATFQDSGQGLTFQDLADVFGFTLPPIPSDLDLDLTGAFFTYDFGTGPTGGTLAFGLQSASYGNASFVQLPSSSPAAGSYFVLDSNQTFSLSNLPLVGAELAQIENVEVSDLVVVISSLVPLPPSAVPAINAAIRSGYPTMPAAGVDAALLLAANLAFGSESPLAMALALGGGSSGNGGGAAPPPAAGSGGVTSTPAGSVTWFNVEKSFGPLSIQKVGVSYQSATQTLWFELDATLAFGPLTLSLVGLGLGSPLTSFSPQFSLSGLGLSYANPPLTIAGTLVNLAPAGASYIEFEGAVTIGADDFVLQAFGYYGNPGGFPSLFLFGDLAYAFGGPPAFFVTGVALGFGYNSYLQLPTVEQVQSFPFVQVLPGSTQPNTALFGPNPTPQSVLQSILGATPPWVQQQGALWFAAGITFTSFQLVNSQALLVVETGSELVISLLGTSQAQFPQPGDSSFTYAYVELDLDVVLTPAAGTFTAQAVLASSSFLLDPACVLTGGFAFFVWFGSNPHAGDFVLTLGGYNPGFVPPSYYPSVPEVGFDWSLDASITISGGAYFALTPAVLMFGGGLDATYQDGKLSAWFDADADVTIDWKPFWFEAEIGISIGASYKIDLLFTSFTVTVELGCELALWGPPTGGTVTIDWYVISFTIPFGTPQPSATPQVAGWSDVQAMLPDSGGSGASNLVAILAGSGLTPLTTSPANGQPAPGSGSAAWVVSGSAFGFATSTPIPASSATVGASFTFTGSTFNVYPLGWTGVTATHAVTITDAGSGGDVSAAFQASPVLAAVPAALWGPLPSSPGPPPVPSSTGLVVPGQLMGVTVGVDPPQVGASAGPVAVAANLASDDLDLPGAVLPLARGTSPRGALPVVDPFTVALIADPQDGIASSAARAARREVLDGLARCGYAPATANATMHGFAAAAGCAFSAPPLLAGKGLP